MYIPSRDIVENLRKRYEEGTRVELVHMADDPRPVPAGIRGTVKGVDDMGSILVNWDNGSSLSVIYGIDEVKIVGYAD